MSETNITMTEEEKSLYGSWSKDDIYEAYILENAARRELNKELNKLRRQLKELEWNLNQLLKDSF